MQTRSLVILADAHLGHPDAPPPSSLTGFFERVPDLGDHLVIAGDLFEFWFAWRRVIPRSALVTLTDLRRLVDRGVGLTVVGGNHDRFGASVWQNDLGAAYHDGFVELTVGRLRVRVAHGDEINDPGALSRFFSWTVRRSAVRGAFQWIHPDVSLPMVDRFSRWLGKRSRRPEVQKAASIEQAQWARTALEQEGAPDVLVLAHTHIPWCEPVGPRWFVNPGAWLDGGRYAIVGPGGPSLAVWDL